MGDYKPLDTSMMTALFNAIKAVAELKYEDERKPALEQLTKSLMFLNNPPIIMEPDHG